VGNRYLSHCAAGVVHRQTDITASMKNSGVSKYDLDDRVRPSSSLSSHLSKREESNLALVQQ
jgi:hypothetical protein